MTTKHPRTESSHRTSQKKAKLVHGPQKTQEKHEDAENGPKSSRRPIGKTYIAPYTLNKTAITLSTSFDERTCDENCFSGECGEYASAEEDHSRASTVTYQNEGVEQDDAKISNAESWPTSVQLPATYSYPRLDRKRGSHDDAAGPNYAIQDAVTKEVTGDTRAEMPYLNTDKEITNLFDELWNSIDTLSKEYFSEVIPDDQKQKWLQSIPKSLSRKRAQDLEFVQLVDQVTVGGPCGVGSWEHIFLEPELRRGVVCGVIWRKLQQEVFGKMLFGGTQSQEKKLLDLEKSMIEDSDGTIFNLELCKDVADLTIGFARTTARGLEVRKMLNCPKPTNYYITLTKTGTFPWEMEKASQTISQSLYGLLSYLTPRSRSSQVFTSLEQIAHKAAIVSHLLRLDTETIYHFPFIEKDSPFNPIDNPVTHFSTSHEAWLQRPEDRADATATNPRYALTEDKIKQIHRSNALIRVICSGAVETYRKGGWRPQDINKGFRKRTLFSARVILRWERPREKSSLPSGDQKSTSPSHNNPASYMTFHDAVRRLGVYRDIVTNATCGEGIGKTWYLRRDLVVGDPARDMEGYTVLGARGRDQQPPRLEVFKPSQSWC